MCFANWAAKGADLRSDRRASPAKVRKTFVTSGLKVAFFRRRFHRNGNARAAPGRPRNGWAFVSPYNDSAVGRGPRPRSAWRSRDRQHRSTMFFCCGRRRRPDRRGSRFISSRQNPGIRVIGCSPGRFQRPWPGRCGQGRIVEIPSEPTLVRRYRRAAIEENSLTFALCHDLVDHWIDVFGSRRSSRRCGLFHRRPSHAARRRSRCRDRPGRSEGRQEHGRQAGSVDRDLRRKHQPGYTQVGALRPSACSAHRFSCRWVCLYIESLQRGANRVGRREGHD